MNWTESKWAGALFGLAGGVVGLVAMNRAIKGASRAFERMSKEQGAVQGAVQPEASLEERSISLVGVRHREEERSTEALARIGYHALTGREPSQEQKKRLGNAVHSGYGLAMAAIYGALRQRYPQGSDTLAGTAYGAVLWVLGDELLVPLLGLSDKPTAFPPSEHVPALVAHLAYGAALGATAGGLRRLSERV